MPINSNSPNSSIDIAQYSAGVRDRINALQNPSITTALGTPGKLLQDRMTLLREISNKIDQPILKSFAQDMLGVLASWLDDPEVLCCLIHGIWAAYAADKEINTSQELVLADTEFANFLDMLITFVDFVITLLTQDLKRLTFMIPDIIKEIFTAIMGAILLVVQETLFALRDSVISVIFEWMDSWDNEGTWSKCLPLKSLINILKKYVHDYGLLADLLNKIKAYVAGMRVGWSKKAEQAVPNAKDLEFLYWVRDLLVKLKRAVLNFDFCVDYEFVPKANTNEELNNQVNDPNFDNKTVDAASRSRNQLNDDPNNKLGYTIAGDGSILVDKDKLTKQRGTYVPRVSNSFLREFIHNEYGLPYDVIDNTISRGSSNDHIQGTNVTSNSDLVIDRCADTPTAEETLRFMLNLKDRTT